MPESNETDFWLAPLHLFTNRLIAPALREMQASFLLGALGRKCRENLWFDRKRFEIWLVNTGHVKTKGVGKLDSFQHILWYNCMKPDKYSSCYHFLYLSEQVVYFHKSDYWINLSHYLQLLVEVLLNRCS